MAKSAAQRTGLLRRVAPYLLPAQKAMIYKAIIRSKMEYSSTAWYGATPTSLAQLDAVQRRAIRIIGLPENDLLSHQIQPLATRRQVELSHFSTACIMVRPLNFYSNCYLNIISWIPVCDALLDPTT